ncbi:hypothetical protein EYV94_08695 [Puteibacter caeruleilacunae]|nr:hypothetical protein EYV94_08695 [Puteibacter caeruleilacunae]
MENIDVFFKEELNDYSRKVILDIIRDGEKYTKEREEVVLNRFSIEISFIEKKVIIYDDIFTEDEPLELSLDELLVYLK